MRNIGVVLTFLFLLIACNLLTPVPEPTPPPSGGQEATPTRIQSPDLSGTTTLSGTQEVVDGMKALCFQEDWWGYLSEAESQVRQAKDEGQEIDIGATFLENLEAAGVKFDPNRYFTVLTHLAPEEGYLLDYVYFGPGGDGFPWLYARRESDPPFADHSAYEAAGSEGYQSHIRVDGTPEGYFELALLRIMGEQFYLAWHGGYNDWEVVGSQERVDEIIELMNEKYAPLTKEQERSVSKLDLAPRVTFKRDKVQVQVVVFTKWGGFFKRVYTINKDFPHHMTEKRTELVPYNCGKMF